MERGIRIAWLPLAFCVCAGSDATSPPHDLVLRGGRVMDPETGLDAIRDVGIVGGRIAAISDGRLVGRELVDASGLVVAPGFVDLHRHDMTPPGQRFQPLDGVTTGLELEAGSFPVASLGSHAPLDFAERAVVNFGASAGHAWLRGKLLEGERAPTGIDDLSARVLRGEPVHAGLGGPAFTLPLDGDGLVSMREGLLRGLDDGGLGIGLLLDYMSEVVGDAELRLVFEVAAERGAPVFVHVRRGVAGDPAGLVEVLELAGASGAPVHVCHVQADAMGAIEEFLARISAARASGLRA